MKKPIEMFLRILVLVVSLTSHKLHKKIKSYNFDGIIQSFGG